ncbi:MAG: helix-turn-helix domain-containing protein [Methylocella sp.]
MSETDDGFVHDGHLLTAKQAAQILCISPRMLQEHVKDGTLPRIAIGRGELRKHYAYDPADIEAFKRARKEFGGRQCPSTKGKARRSTASTSNLEVFDFQALRKQLLSEKQKQ